MGSFHSGLSADRTLWSLFKIREIFAAEHSEMLLHPNRIVGNVLFHGRSHIFEVMNAHT